RHLAFRVDLEVVGRTVLLPVQRGQLQLERGADLVQRDMRRHRTGTRRVVQRQHWVVPAGLAPSITVMAGLVPAIHGSPEQVRGRRSEAAMFLKVSCAAAEYRRPNDP